MRDAILISTAAIAALTLGGCVAPAADGPTDPDGASPALAEVAVGDTFRLAPGQTATLPGARLSVRFIEATADSRCPVDVTCVWEGDVTVVVETTRAGIEGAWGLHWPSERIGPRGVDLDGYLLEVVGVEPATRSDRRIPPAEYRAALRVVPAGAP